MHVMRVENVEAAIELATDLKQRGQYDWFRGQVQGWNPASSLERKLKDGTSTQESYTAEVQAFMEWASGVSELAYLTKKGGEDAAFAILQHHGTPTQYIDFTTDPSVAGFFSADAAVTPNPGTESVIFCLQSQDLLRLYKYLQAGQPELQLKAVSVDVSNLWRLQAQHGCFIFANHSWYKVYDLDRIVFPWTGYPAYPQREHLYPAHKSSLERRLDEYFSVRRRREGTARAREMLRGGGVVWIDVTEEDDDITTAAGQINTTLWSQELLAHWTQHSIERYDDTIGPQKRLQLRSGPNTPAIGNQVSVAITSMLRREPGLRRRAIDWQFLGLPHDTLATTLAEASRTLWNGIRCLPASDEDVAHAFRALVELSCAQAADPALGETGAAGPAFEAPLYVEFATLSSVVSRGYCTSGALLGAISAHWQRSSSEVPENGSPNDVKSLLLSNNRPNQVFEFERFARVFIRQIVPSQIALGRDPVIFNPAELSVFGLS